MCAMRHSWLNLHRAGVVAAGEAFAVPVIGTYLAPAFATRESPLPGVPGADGLGPDGNVAGAGRCRRGPERSRRGS